MPGSDEPEFNNPSGLNAVEGKSIPDNMPYRLILNKLKTSVIKYTGAIAATYIIPICKNGSYENMVNVYNMITVKKGKNDNSKNILINLNTYFSVSGTIKNIDINGKTITKNIIKAWRNIRMANKIDIAITNVLIKNSDTILLLITGFTFSMLYQLLFNLYI